MTKPDRPEDRNASGGGRSDSNLMSSADGLSEADYDRKLDYVVDKYELDGIIEYIQKKWEAEGDDRWGIRVCAEHINESIVDTVLDNMVEQPPLGTSEEIAKTLLADDDDSEVVNQAELKSWFRRHGGDPDELTNDLIHYRTVYNYLREIKDAESPSEIYDEEELIQRAATRENRTKDKVIQRMEDRAAFHDRKGLLPHDDYDITVQITVRCGKCGRLADWSDMIAEGCDCMQRSNEHT